MLRQAEELVMEARLEQIAREHKSMGAVLDNRTLYPLEEIKFQTKKSLRMEIEKRLHGRRGGRSETDIKSKVNMAVETFKEKGINVTILTGNYELEQKIWKNKSSKRSYAQRRHLQYPELDEFLLKMSSSQMVEYQDRISHKLIELVDRFRKECGELKVEMDLNGIFHPDANGQRVHCIYLMKLEKGISSTNIEDPVLKEMYTEAYDKQCQELEVEIKKLQMLKDLEDQEKTTSKRSDVKLSPEKNTEAVKEDNILSMMEKTEVVQPNLYDVEVLRSKIVKLKPFKERVVEKRDLSKSNLLPRIPFVKSSSAKNLKSTKDDAQLAHSHSADTKFKLEVAEPGNRRPDDTESSGSSQHSHMKGNVSSPTKLFSKKLKHERMGYMDARSVLSEEAARFDAADAHVSRRSFDKNPLLDETLSKWMLTEMQKNQIMMASSGGITNSTNRTALTSLVDETPHAYATPGCFSPQKMLPFDEFYGLLKIVSDGEGKSSPSKIGDASSTRRHGKLSLDDGSPAKSKVVTDDEHLLPPEPINIVKHLMEKDKHFDAFLKMNEREQPSSKLLEKLNASVMKPRRQRKVPQLGKDAITLSNSRGQPSKMASRGFTNVFVQSVADSKDFSGDGKDSRVHVGFQVRMVKERDIGEPPDVIDRLLHDTKDARKRKESSATANGDGLSGDEPMKFPFYVSKAKAGNVDSRVSKEDALSYMRSQLRDCVDDTMFTFDEHVEIDMQNKLLASWEALTAPMHDRLTFMDKYSSFAYAAEMSRAVDMWSEVAVFVTLLTEAINLHKKLQAGLMIFPVSGSTIVKQLIRKIHPLLAASAPCLVPPAILYDNQIQVAPLSVAAMIRGRELTTTTIANQNIKNERATGEPVIDRSLLLSETDAELVFCEMLSQLSQDLVSSLKQCHRELEDVIPFGNLSCKEWLLSLDIPRQRTTLVSF